MYDMTKASWRCSQSLFTFHDPGMRLRRVDRRSRHGSYVLEFYRVIKPRVRLLNRIIIKIEFFNSEQAPSISAVRKLALTELV